jgi:hypothetical protein
LCLPRPGFGRRRLSLWLNGPAEHPFRVFCRPALGVWPERVC